MHSSDTVGFGSVNIDAQAHTQCPVLENRRMVVLSAVSRMVGKSRKEFLKTITLSFKEKSNLSNNATLDNQVFLAVSEYNISG